MDHELDEHRLPAHVAIIMDGNGRWAQQRHLPRIAGHKRGMNVIEEITTTASDLGIKVLTVYAFSTENWKRPAKEIKYIMSLPTIFFKNFVPKLIKNNIKVTTIGDESALPPATQAAVTAAKEDTSENTGMILNFAINYGSRDELVEVMQRLGSFVQQGKLRPDQITAATIASQLETAQFGEAADPDVIIRTSGEQRLSNFFCYGKLLIVNSYSRIRFGRISPRQILWIAY